MSVRGWELELSVEAGKTLGASLVLGLKVAYLITAPDLVSEVMGGKRFQALMKIDYLFS